MLVLNKLTNIAHTVINYLWLLAHIPTTIEALYVPFPTQTLNLLGKIDSFSASRTTIGVFHVEVLLRRGFGLGHGGGGYLAVALVAVEIILVQVTGARLQLFLACFFGC